MMPEYEVRFLTNQRAGRGGNYCRMTWTKEPVRVFAECASDALAAVANGKPADVCRAWTRYERKDEEKEFKRRLQL